MNIAKYLEHTLLKPEATVTDIMKLCEEAKEYNLGGVCVNTCYAGLARHLLTGTDVKIVTVVGFPLGADRSEVKALATKLAVDEDHVDEVDMVMNMSAFKSGNYDGVVEDISAVVEAAKPYSVKVIIETCLLTDEEKIKMCQLVTEAGADYIKTSTGFSTGGATFQDIELFSKNIGENVRMKAAGGIASLDDAEKFLSLGAERLGTSRIVSIAKNEEGKGY